MTSNETSDSASRCVFTWATSVPFSPRSDLKRRSHKKQEHYYKNKMSSDVRSIPDLKIGRRFVAKFRILS